MFIIKILIVIVVRICLGFFLRLKSRKEKKVFLVVVFFYLFLGLFFVFLICFGFFVMGYFVCFYNMNFGGGFF